MADRRAIQRVPLAIPATIHDGKAEIHCAIRDISPLGVTVTGVTQDLPSRALRLRLSASGRAHWLVCDCFPVGKQSGRSDSWGLRLLGAPEDLSATIQKLVDEVRNDQKSVARAPSVSEAPKSPSSNNTESVESDRADLERQLRNLYRKSLDSLI